MGSNPARVACEIFSTDTRKALEYTVLYTRRCKGKIKSIVYHLTQKFHQPINITWVSGGPSLALGLGKAWAKPGQGLGKAWASQRLGCTLALLPKCSRFWENNIKPFYVFFFFLFFKRRDVTNQVFFITFQLKWCHWKQSLHDIVHGVPRPRGLVHRICVLMAESLECGFESWLRLWCLCPWARHFTIIASLHPGVNGYLWGQSWLLCLISPLCAEMAAIELCTPQGAEMVSGMIYAPDEQG